VRYAGAGGCLGPIRCATPGAEIGFAGFPRSTGPRRSGSPNSRLGANDWTEVHLEGTRLEGADPVPHGPDDQQHHASGHQGACPDLVARGEDREHSAQQQGDPDGVPVGWCSISPRSEIPRLEQSKLIRPTDDTPVWSIICVVVRSGHRKQGVTEQMLEGAVAYARPQGAPAVEAHPVDPGDNGWT
jgi:GNAT superfamily N-acetyltransferase